MDKEKVFVKRESVSRNLVDCDWKRNRLVLIFKAYATEEDFDSVNEYLRLFGEGYHITKVDLITVGGVQSHGGLCTPLRNVARTNFPGFTDEQDRFIRNVWKEDYDNDIERVIEEDLMVNYLSY